MRIEYQKKTIDPVNDKIDPSQKKSFVIAVVVAFISVFVWFFKILFF